MIVETVSSLPLQSKIVLYAILLKLEKKEKAGFSGGVNTGEVYCYYKQLCSKTGLTCLSQRSIADVISSLDSMGIINDPIISKGRMGRSRQINISYQSNVLSNILAEDQSFKDIFKVKINDQSKLP